MLSGKLFPAHPQPKRDELFSSWVTRIAQANGLKLHTLGLHIWDRKLAYEIWTRDIDNSATRKTVADVCKRTGVSLKRGLNTTLSSYEGILFEHHTPNGLTRWILPAGVYHRTRRRRWIVYCPLCLKMDEEPYFRRSWRLSLNTVCERHGNLMLDACPQCNSPVAYFRRELGNRRKFIFDSMVLCHQCNFDLCNGPAWSPPAPDGQSLAMLRSLVAFHDMGWWFTGAKTLHYSIAYFDVLHHLSTFLTSKVGGRLLNVAEAEIGCRRFSGTVFERMQFEKRPIEVRHWLLIVALWLILDWPGRFVRICGKAVLTRSRIMRSETFPFWFQKMADENLNIGHSSSFNYLHANV